MAPQEGAEGVIGGDPGARFFNTIGGQGGRGGGCGFESLEARRREAPDCAYDGARLSIGWNGVYEFGFLELAKLSEGVSFCQVLTVLKRDVVGYVKEG